MAGKPEKMIYLGYEEEWRFIYLNNEITKYQVSNLGEIRNTKRNNKILEQVVDRYGYNQICLCHKGKHYVLGVHRIVALAFIPNEDPINKFHVNHKDGRKFNNSVDNLEWTTPKENIIHCHKMGLHKNKAIGENHGQNKYLTSDIIYLCELLESGCSINEASRKTGIPKGTVTDIYLRKYWTHISKDYDFSNVEKEHPRDFENHRDTIIKLGTKGTSIEEICNELNITYDERSKRCIKYYIKRYC